MLDCGHVFCVDCLRDFYNSAIREGNIAAVVCLEPNCARDRAKAASSGGKRKKVKTFIHPSELLQIPLDPEVVKRYLMLRYKMELESDRSTVYCPRKWCNGAARSKKHKKPQGLELPEASDDSASEGEEEDDEDTAEDEDNKPKRERLAICEECGFAFCARCLQSWHGELNFCPKSREEILAAAELASLEYIRLHTTPCPKCAAPAQKTQGCNHMHCSRCGTHFCYLCSARLDPENPYRHFNTPPSADKSQPCYMRLWELGEGDGADVPGFERMAAGLARPARAANPPRGRPREGVPHADGNGVAAAGPTQGGHANGGGQAIQVNQQEQQEEQEEQEEEEEEEEEEPIEELRGTNPQREMGDDSVDNNLNNPNKPPGVDGEAVAPAAPGRTPSGRTKTHAGGATTTTSRTPGRTRDGMPG
ncbi:hypothetical protein VTH06DRAFT_6010 [Thermothelomyces fergusii]